MVFYVACRRCAGFTLIEITIVIAIIAILAGIMVPNFVQARAEASYQACVKNCETYTQVMVMYLTRHSEQQLASMTHHGGSRLFGNESGQGVFQCATAYIYKEIFGKYGYMEKELICPINGKLYYMCKNYFVIPGESQAYPDWGTVCGLPVVTHTMFWHKMNGMFYKPCYFVGLGSVEITATE